MVDNAFPYSYNQSMKFFIVLGVSAVPFVLSYLAFRDDETGLGWTFLLVGIALAVLGIIASGKRR